jgi:hypothetical protein
MNKQLDKETIISIAIALLYENHEGSGENGEIAYLERIEIPSFVPIFRDDDD